MLESGKMDNDLSPLSQIKYLPKDQNLRKLLSTNRLGIESIVIFYPPKICRSFYYENRH